MNSTLLKKKQNTYFMFLTTEQKAINNQNIRNLILKSNTFMINQLF